MIDGWTERLYFQFLEEISLTPRIEPRYSRLWVAIDYLEKRRNRNK